jgi:type II secretory ATPase GspE/PulE/Tfp pilus assembly ATPase PilB-like protein
MSDYNSIDNLINSDGIQDEDTTQGKLAKKQQEIKIKEMEEQTKAKAEKAGLEHVNLFAFPISPDAIVLVDEKDAKEKEVICFYYDGENIRLATTDPEAKAVKEIQKELDAKYYTKSRIYLISQYSFDYALEVYKAVPKVKKYDSGVDIPAEDLEKFKNEITDYKKLDEKINQVNISDIVTLILATAIKVNVSDVHIEAEDKRVIVRLRIDGVLQEAATIKKEQWKKIISRLKLLSGVRINIEGRPQDGRFKIYLPDEEIDVRASFLPTAYGESVVMRILRSKSIQLGFEKLGLRDEAFKILKEQIKKPNGLILTTGPTGSGKTTTLYSILSKLNQPGTKIITLEDPIEYQLEGINQSQIDRKKEYTFANGLRSVLRQDPDIVMVGEIRDLDTAEISVQASLTGHLVLSTLHTNDASGVIPRLIDMGVKPYFLVPSINAVIGQRLIRKLCGDCKVEYQPNEEEEEKVKKILAVISPKANIEVPTEIPKLYKASPDGCNKCNNIGYKGRVGIYEIFTLNDEIKELVMKEAASFKILQQAIENGMITMLQDGILKAIEGLTSLEEIYRVSGDTDYIDELYDIVISQTIGRGIKISQEEIDEAKKLSQDLVNINTSFKDVAVQKLLKIIIAMAVEAEAGDIHIEPTENTVKLRFRIDGVLHDVVDLSKDHYLPLLSKIKILIGVATNIKKPTIDGRFSIKMPEKRADSRVSIISGGYGETIVIRLLASQAQSLDLKELGMEKYSLEPLIRSISKTKGIIITTGPTGSGKTTTLYSVLNKLNTPDVKIITVEDPIEYQMPGLMQTQIDSDQGYTFAAAMKSLLRQNPNIMMVGEIRDEETANMAIEAATTGHLVLSTLHANSAASAVSRLSGLNVPRQLLSNALEASIGQRLARRVCPHCREKIKVEEKQLNDVKEVLDSISDKAKVEIPSELKFYKGKGCPKCNSLGYKGRIGIYEVMEVSNDIRKAIQSKEVIDHEIEELAIQAGTVTMLQDGVIKALKGYTTLDEAFKSLK